MPPPAPCPDTSTTPVHNQLTPELQQAMEKWLTDRIKVGGGIDTIDHFQDGIYIITVQENLLL